MASSQVAVICASLRALIAATASALMGENSIGGAAGAGVAAGTGVAAPPPACAYGAGRGPSGVSPGRAPRGLAAAL